MQKTNQPFQTIFETGPLKINGRFSLIGTKMIAGLKYKYIAWWQEGKLYFPRVIFITCKIKPNLLKPSL